MEDPQEDPLAVRCFCVCSGNALLGDLLGVSRSRERDLLSVLFIYPRFFLHVFTAYHLLVGLLFVWLYSAICSCMLVVLVKLSVLAKWLAIEGPRWGHINMVRILSPWSPGVFVFFFLCDCILLYVHMFWLFWFSCQYLPSDWLERPL